MKSHDIGHGIILTMGVGAGSCIECNNWDECPSCGSRTCYFDCDLSQLMDETEQDARDRLVANGKMSAIMSMAQNMANKGVPIDTIKEVVDETYNDMTNEV